MQFHPPRATGIALGALASAWAFLFAALLVLRGATEPVSLSTVFCYLYRRASSWASRLVIAAYWTYACGEPALHTRPERPHDPLGLRPTGRPPRQRQAAGPRRAHHAAGISGIDWPGYHVGRAEVRELGETLFYSTHRRLADIVYVVTPSLTYAVSPLNPTQFIEASGDGAEAEPAIPLRQAPHRVSLLDQPFWLDRYAQGLAVAAVLLCAATFGVIFRNYAGLPQNMAISFPPLDVERIASKHDLLSLPATAFAVLAVSLVVGFAVRAWERLASYIVLASLVAVQVVFLWGAAVAVS